MYPLDALPPDCGSLQERFLADFELNELILKHAFLIQPHPERGLVDRVLLLDVASVPLSFASPSVSVSLDDPCTTHYGLFIRESNSLLA